MTAGSQLLFSVKYSVILQYISITLVGLLTFQMS